MLRVNPTKIELRDSDLKEYEATRLTWKSVPRPSVRESLFSDSPPADEAQRIRAEDLKKQKEVRHARLGYTLGEESK